jgi:hypothetical protein
MHEAKAEITRIFAEPFPAPGASGPSESQLPDRVEQKSAGLHLEYSASTAEWLRRVVEAPHDFALVYNFVSNLLSDSDQPLGALTRRFATLFDSLFLPTHQSSLRKSFSAEALTEKLAGPAASRSRHKSTIASAASSMHLGVNRLHRRCIDVLPPLQCAAASLAAMEAVQAALFELCGPTLHALVGLIVSTEDVALQARPRSNTLALVALVAPTPPAAPQARLSQLSHLHPHHFGLPELFWLGQPPPQQRTGAALAVKSLDRAYPVGAKAEESQPLEHASPHLVLACPVEPGNTVEAGAEDASTEVPCSGEASTEASMLVLARPVEEACFKPPVAATSPPPSVPLWQRLGGGAPVTAPPVAPPAFVPPRTDEPYSAAIAYVQALPRFASPRQKLRLLADACTEAARCVERHHRSTASTMPAAVPGRPPPYPLPVDNPPRTPPRSPPRTPGSRTPTRMRSGDGLRRLPSWHVGLSAAEGGDLPLRRLPSLHIPVEVAAAAAADWEVAAARAVEEEMAEMAARQEAMEAEAAGEGGEAEEAEEELEGEEETTFDQAATMAADDLIPVMSYVLARARMPQVLSEVRFVEAFARGAGEEGLLLGRLGYGLATFQAALQLLGSAELDPAAIAAMEPGAASEAAARADARARGRSCGLQLEPVAALADMRHSIACGGKRRPSGGAAEWERSLLADLVFRRRCARTQPQRTLAPPCPAVFCIADGAPMCGARRRHAYPATPLHATACRPRSAAALVCCCALLCAAMHAQGE